jgi:hypothetical protein
MHGDGETPRQRDPRLNMTRAVGRENRARTSPADVARRINPKIASNVITMLP